MLLSEKIQEMIDAAELLHDDLESTISAVNEANRPVLSKLKNMSFYTAETLRGVRQHLPPTYLNNEV